NCPWTVEEAIRIGRALERFDLRWLEEPVWPPEDYDGLARVRSAIRIPLACGENEATAFGIRAIIDAAAADIVQPSVTKVGGILEMKKIATLAAVTGVTFVPHSYYYGPGLAATLHVVASTPGVPYAEFPPGGRAAPADDAPRGGRGVGAGEGRRRGAAGGRGEREWEVRSRRASDGRGEPEWEVRSRRAPDCRGEPEVEVRSRRAPDGRGEPEW